MIHLHPLATCITFRVASIVRSTQVIYLEVAPLLSMCNLSCNSGTSPLNVIQLKMLRYYGNDDFGEQFPETFAACN